MARILFKTEDGREVWGLDPQVVERKAVDPDEGIYELTITSEVEDRDGDIVRAAGGKLKNFRKNPVVLFAHDYRSPPVAKSLEEKIVKGKGIDVRFQFPPHGDSPRADEIHALWRGEFLNAASIGFIPVRKEPLGHNEDGEFVRTGWDIQEWELLEWSIVPVPANQEALRRAIGIMEEKEMETIIKTVIGHRRFPLAPEDTPWDAGAARNRIRQWAGGDNVNFSKYRLAFVFLTGPADNLTSYVGPHHDVIGGGLKTVWNGVRAAMASLVYGARGGRITDEGDRRGVYGHLAAHYREFDKEVPEFRDLSEEEWKAFFGEGSAEEELSEEELTQLAEALEVYIKNVEEVLKL